MRFQSVSLCILLDVPRNGSLESYTDTTEGSEVFYRCDQGLVPEWRVRANCTRNGWSPNPADLCCTKSRYKYLLFSIKYTFFDVIIECISCTLPFTLLMSYLASLVAFQLHVTTCAHVPPAMSLLQLSSVLCHSLLQHWLVLWYIHYCTVRKKCDCQKLQIQHILQVYLLSSRSLVLQFYIMISLVSV